MKSLNYFFFSINILLINSLVDSEGWSQPKNLSQIRILYNSGERGNEKPIITYKNVYFIWKYYTNVYNLNKQKETTLPPKLYRKPLLYTNTVFSFYTLFLTKDCKIYLFEEDGEKTFDNLNYLGEIKFNNLGLCYDSLRIYYDHTTRYAAVYNFQKSNNINILNFEKAKNGDNGLVITKDNEV